MQINETSNDITIESNEIITAATLKENIQKYKLEEELLQLESQIIIEELENDISKQTKDDPWNSQLYLKERKVRVSFI